MNQFFLELLNNALISSFLIIAVIITRVCIKKAPKWIACLLWGLVAIKLLLPFQIESVLSLLPASKPISIDAEYQTKSQNLSNATIDNSVSNPEFMPDTVPDTAPDFTPEFTVDEVAHASSAQLVISVASAVWLMGMVILCIYAAVSFYLLRKKVAASKNIYENVYVCDDVGSPFILGIIRPRIYLPSGMEDSASECVIEHEKAHLRRFDYIWKPLGFLILTVYWFNPLCWISYVLLCKDIEFACDEVVTKDKDKAWKAAYCQTLLDCSTKRRHIAACPVAFGEVSVKDRVRSVLNYKKPAFWIVLTAILLSIVVAVCFMTSPKSDSNDVGTESVDATAASIEAPTEKTTDAELPETTFSGATESGVHISTNEISNPDTGLAIDVSDTADKLYMYIVFGEHTNWKPICISVKESVILRYFLTDVAEKGDLGLENDLPSESENIYEYIERHIDGRMFQSVGTVISTATSWAGFKIRNGEFPEELIAERYLRESE